MPRSYYRTRNENGHYRRLPAERLGPNEITQTDFKDLDAPEEGHPQPLRAQFRDKANTLSDQQADKMISWIERNVTGPWRWDEYISGGHTPDLTTDVYFEWAEDERRFQQVFGKDFKYVAIANTYNLATMENRRERTERPLRERFERLSKGRRTSRRALQQIILGLRGSERPEATL